MRSPARANWLQKGRGILARTRRSRHPLEFLAALIRAHALLAALAAGSVMLEKKTTAEGAEVLAPRFEVDPLWPKPLPNHWVQGMSVGVSVDPRDHVWIVHRTNTFEPMEIYASAQPPKAECCVPAPPVLEFDEEGNLIGHWGGPGQGYDWPDSNHGITVDYKGNVW